MKWFIRWFQGKSLTELVPGSTVVVFMPHPVAED